MHFCRCVLLLLASASLPACTRGCRRNSRPYTPYSIGDESGAVAEASSSPASGSSVATDRPVPPPFQHVAAAGLVDDAGAVQLPEGRVEPPPDSRFVLALRADLDGDGVSDLVTWTVGIEPLGGRLLFFRAKSAQSFEQPSVLAALEGGKIGIAGCAPEPKLEQIGSRTVAIAVRAVCPVPLDGSIKSRWVGVASATREPTLREQLWIGEPPGENLKLELDAADQDGDGLDDLSVRFLLDGAPPGFEPSIPVAASLRYYDRQAGLSRDPQQPEASLREAAGSLSGLAGKKTDAPKVGAAARELERLHALLCADEGLATVSLGSGQMRCGPSRALEDAVAARVRAALTLGDAPRALAALAQARFRPATTQRRAELEKAIIKAVPVKTPTARLASVKPMLDPPGIPAWGPLLFTPAGDLLVRGMAEVVAIDTVTGEEKVAQGVALWPSAVTSPDATLRWLSAFDPCDGAALHVRFGTPSDAPFVVPAAVGAGREFLAPILAPAPSRCASEGARFDLDPVPIGWGAAGLVVWIAGEPVLMNPTQVSTKAIGSDWASAEPPHPGSPRSPDGRMMAIGTPLGVLVYTVHGWQLWRPNDREGAHAYTGLHACTIANDAKAVACIRGGRVLVMVPSR